MRRMKNRPFACASARHQTFEVGELTLHALEWGTPERPGLLLLHGGAAHAHWFDRVAGAFTDRFHVVSLDQRGHGESRWPDPPAYATEDFAGDLEAVADRLGWDRFVLVGHSMGGHNSLAFSAWHPGRVRGLVMLDARPALPPERLTRMHERGRRPLRRHPTADAAVAAFRLLPRDTVADPALLAHLARAGIEERDGGWVYRFDPAANEQRKPTDGWALLDRIVAPTLIMRAEFSPGLPREAAKRLRDGIRQAMLVEIPGAYHHVTLDNPDTVVTNLDRFLTALPGV
jgi:pimeloyl-ACP methyl ester carboxylesterase